MNDDRRLARALRFLARGAVAIEATSSPDRVLLDGGDRGRIGLEAETLKALVGLELVRRSGSTIELTATGRAHMARASATGDRFAEQHRHVVQRSIATDGGLDTVTVNDAESPLRLLSHRRDRLGRPILTSREIDAGERLRSDYTRGQIMPRMGANWQAAVSSGRRSGSRGAADLTESALAARQRVDRAIAAVGPELSGVLVDVCCFLKGLETVEVERGWPVRSAKIVLKTALACLARHYWPEASASEHRRQAVLHWGGEGYRPTLFPQTAEIRER